MRHILALALPLALFATPALAEDIEFDFENGTTSNVVGFYASPVGVESWEDNMLSEPMAPGTTGHAKFESPEGVCEYDLQIVTDDSDPLVDQAVDLCEMDTYPIEDG